MTDGFTYSTPYNSFYPDATRISRDFRQGSIRTLQEMRRQRPDGPAQAVPWSIWRPQVRLRPLPRDSDRATAAIAWAAHSRTIADVLGQSFFFRYHKRQRNTPICRLFKRMKGLEPSTFCMASRRSSQLSYIRESGHHSRSPALSRASFTSRSASSLCSRRTAV
jgi:hypothetical protein